MRNLFVLPVMAGLVFVIGCVEKPIEETGSSTVTPTIQEEPVDCCVQPDQDEPNETPSTDGAGPEPQADGAELEGSSEEN
jgi:hypothetical protein